MIKFKIVGLLLINILLSTATYAQKPVAVKMLPDDSGFTTKNATINLGKGFYDHGVASPISNHRGVVSTIDGQGRNVVLVWLFDHRGGYALLMIDALTGKSEEFKIPFDPRGDTPYSSVLSSDNKFYSMFQSHFVEFDPVKRAFTYTSQAMPQMAMAMTEDDQGKIWAVTYPNSGLVSFDPKTRIFKDYKSVNKENWKQYHKYMAADDSGWVYFGLGNASSQLFAFDPATEKISAILPKEERTLGMAYVVRDLNGKVYGCSNLDLKDAWYELHNGKGRKIGVYKPNPKAIITSNQALFHKTFPDGTVIKSLDLVRRRLVTEMPATKAPHSVTFEYSSDGAIVMGVARAADGSVVGGTAFPMRFFNYHLKTDTWINRLAAGQLNAIDTQGDKNWFGVYSQGHLVEWNPAKKWTAVSRTNEQTNPRFLASSSPDLIRPFRLFAHPDGKTIIMGGTPQYGATGGALLFWDRHTMKHTLVKDSNVVLNQSTMSLVALPGGKILGGSTTTPGSGGEKKASEAMLYIMDMATKKVEWTQVLFPGVQEYSDMKMTTGGLVYGIADKKLFFVFDPKQRKVVHQQDLKEFGSTIAEQSPRIFVFGPKGEVYLLFRRGSIVLIHPKTYELTEIARSPTEIKAGGDYADGHIFFVCGSHLYSYQLNHDLTDKGHPNRQESKK